MVKLRNVKHPRCCSSRPGLAGRWQDILKVVLRWLTGWLAKQLINILPGLQWHRSITKHAGLSSGSAQAQLRHSSTHRRFPRQWLWCNVWLCSIFKSVWQNNFLACGLDCGVWRTEFGEQWLPSVWFGWDHVIEALAYQPAEQRD